MLDIKKVRADAEAEIREEAATKAKADIKAQLRVVEACKVALANETRKLEDIMAAVAAGN